MGSEGEEGQEVRTGEKSCVMLRGGIEELVAGWHAAGTVALWRDSCSPSGNGFRATGCLWKSRDRNEAGGMLGGLLGPEAEDRKGYRVSRDHTE